MQTPKKKIRALEKELMNALVDPPESDLRRRYVKRWIYGELQATKATKSIGKRLRSIIRK